MENQLSRSLTITHTTCPICGHKEIHHVFDATDHTVSKQSFPIWQCANCEARFTQNIPEESSIGQYYQSESYISHSNTSKGLINSLYQRVRKRTLQQKSELVQDLTGKADGRILDFGCGTGEFLATMKEMGWETLGLEVDEGARNYGIEQYGLLVEPPSRLFDISSGYFDIVTMWHVLEHVHELHACLDGIVEVLVPHGIVVIAVPNYQSKDAKKYQNQWAAYDVPRHLYHFSPKSMKILLDQHGLELKHMKQMPFDAFYVSLLSEKYANGSPRLLKGFWQGYKSWRNAQKNVKECSSVMYICQVAT